MSDAGSSEQRCDPLLILDEIQRNALDLARKASSPTGLAEAVEIVKSSAEARNAILGRGGFQYWITTLMPPVTVLIAMVGLWLQARQYSNSASTQAQQYTDSADRQRDADAHAQWRQAMNVLSYKDGPSALASAMSLQSFFDSSRYGVLSRNVASAALPQVTNVGGFDTLWFALLGDTNATNQLDVIGVAHKIAATQWHRWDAIPSTDKQKYGDKLPFVRTRVDAIDFADPGKSDDFSIAAWELDSMSSGIADLWKGVAGDKTLPATPTGLDRSNLVLENKSFSGLNFSNATLKHSVLSNASFRGAIFTKATLDGAFVMEGVDLCEVTQFANSTWHTVRWKRASCISPELHEYLQEYFQY